MIHFFQSPQHHIYALEHPDALCPTEKGRLRWLFGGATYLRELSIEGSFVGPRKEMITPWSTNAVEITQNMGLEEISRIEAYTPFTPGQVFDKMLQSLYPRLDQGLFYNDITPEPLREIDDIAAYNRDEGLALNEEEVAYLEDLSQRLGRRLTDSEVFGFSQVNSEHCRHKIFNGQFVIDDIEMPETLFQLIKKTSLTHKNRLVSAYTDNVAFIRGPVIRQFAPRRQDIADWFFLREVPAVISMKAETHNFPTTVEPFNGAATGSGGEIRDRMAGGKGSFPLAGTAVYMTSYPRLSGKNSRESANPRKWLYHPPAEILIKASNGASDFGNKFGQPLICGSLLTFELETWNRIYGYDKVIMLAGGVGYACETDSIKGKPGKGEKIVVLGGDNYRIGMGGGAVSSVATGEYNNQIELNAVQRSNPEMQKRVYNAIRALCESDHNPITAIHDHGAGGHLNSLSELVEHCGGTIHIDKLPVGDPSLSDKEIIGNESQERMGLVLCGEDMVLLGNICERERAPFYDVGEVTDDQQLRFLNEKKNTISIDLKLSDLFGKPPRTIIRDKRVDRSCQPLQYDQHDFHGHLLRVLQMEAVACKDWLTNKVDRSVTGRIAMQQTAGSIQLPVNNLGIVCLDYDGIKGAGTSLGHAPAVGLISPEAGSRLSIAEALTNLVWAPAEVGLGGVSLSANWMWPSKQEGEDDRLYRAVKAVSEFSISLGINVPTGKDSLSMTQKYPDGSQVIAPGTVIITAVCEVSDIRKAIRVPLQNLPDSAIFYVSFSNGPFHLGGSSFAQTLGQTGDLTPDIADPASFASAFEAIQKLVNQELVHAGHDISAGGLMTALLEMCFPCTDTGLDIDLHALQSLEPDHLRLLFSENPAVLIQVTEQEKVKQILDAAKLSWFPLGRVISGNSLYLKGKDIVYQLNIPDLRDHWYQTSYLLDRLQSGEEHANLRYVNYKIQPLQFRFPDAFNGKLRKSATHAKPARAAIIREKGVNGDREMAYSLFHAGFEVKDIHMTDLISGREDLSDVNMIVFVGGFSNSDVLGSGKGWAGAFLYNEKAKRALDKFYSRQDTLSLGICNGCQLMMELGLLTPGKKDKPLMQPNLSGKFESHFLNVDIPENQSVMFGPLGGSRLGVWVAHGEGRIVMPDHHIAAQVAARYSYQAYPGNPNGSDDAIAAITSADGRHLAMMPHLERAVFPWQWAAYPCERKSDEVSPWIDAFINAREWILQQT
ncbi:MAG TPA: phosphoribosylformylglycinamidine synthase [Bacteroidales bacterium]|nr:phosphoribosylformylglycinamidine synthase [Bacteroidales bacterium]HSA43441.1 phosphoribosylformylglycinamidine synthase [Bacteroidales bacterium]